MALREIDRYHQILSEFESHTPPGILADALFDAGFSDEAAMFRTIRMAQAKPVSVERELVLVTRLTPWLNYSWWETLGLDRQRFEEVLQDLTFRAEEAFQDSTIRVTVFNWIPPSSVLSGCTFARDGNLLYLRTRGYWPNTSIRSRHRIAI